MWFLVLFCFFLVGCVVVVCFGLFFFFALNPCFLVSPQAWTGSVLAGERSICSSSGWQEGMLGWYGSWVALRCCALVGSMLLWLSLLKLRAETYPHCPWARAPGWSCPAASQPPCDAVLVIQMRMGGYAKINVLLACGLPPANIQALLPSARMSSQLVSPETPCPGSTPSSVLLQACCACRSCQQLLGSSDAPASASERHHWLDTAWCKTLSLGNLPGKTAQPGTACSTGLHPHAPAAPCSLSSVPSLPHLSGSLLGCPFLRH